VSSSPFIPFFDHTPAGPKICGITTPEDALSCIESGAAALGFNFYPPSPRSIPVGADLAWIQKLKAEYRDVAFVAVVVNPDGELLARLRTAGCFDAIQFHGDETADFCAKESKGFVRWIKALRVRSEADLDPALAFATPYLLLDAAVSGTYGGSGETTDWGLAAEFVANHPEKRVILAGGLTPENVDSAVRRVIPHAVDTASGVELEPGRKDPAKVRSFMTAALATE
jgi:phosphoribosylanthranilate isomerase